MKSSRLSTSSGLESFDDDNDDVDESRFSTDGGLGADSIMAGLAGPTCTGCYIAPISGGIASVVGLF